MTSNRKISASSATSLSDSSAIPVNHSVQSSRREFYVILLHGRKSEAGSTRTSPAQVANPGEVIGYLETFKSATT